MIIVTLPHQSGIKKHKIMILGAHTFYNTERRLNFVEKMNTGCITVSKKVVQRRVLKFFLLKVSFKSKKSLFLRCWALTNFLHKKRSKSKLNIKNEKCLTFFNYIRKYLKIKYFETKCTGFIFFFLSNETEYLFGMMTFS